MGDDFVDEFVGARVGIELVGQMGIVRGRLGAAGQLWVMVLPDSGPTTLIPIANVRTMRIESHDERDA